MTSKSGRPTRCQHKPTMSCSLCRRERDELQQVGSWVRDSRPKPTGSTDYASFIRDNPDALRTTTTTTTTKNQTQPQPQQPRKPSQQPQQPPTHHVNTKPQRPYKHHPSLSPSSEISAPFSRITSPPSSVAATRANSPETHRPTARLMPVHNNARQILPASTNAAMVPRNNLRAMTPQTAGRLQTHFILSRGRVVESESEESEDDDSGGAESGEGGDEE